MRFSVFRWVSGTRTFERVSGHNVVCGFGAGCGIHASRSAYTVASIGSGFDEAVAALPLLFEAGPDGFDFGAGHGGVGAFDEAGGFELG